MTTILDPAEYVVSRARNARYIDPLGRLIGSADEGLFWHQELAAVLVPDDPPMAQHHLLEAGWMRLAIERDHEVNVETTRRPTAAQLSTLNRIVRRDGVMYDLHRPGHSTGAPYSAYAGNWREFREALDEVYPAAAAPQRAPSPAGLHCEAIW